MLGQKNCREQNLCQPTCKIHCGYGAETILKIWIHTIESKNNCIKYLQLKLLKQKAFQSVLNESVFERFYFAIKFI